uniref:Cyclin N-terminal domain-containing protein n=1 Tax=Caenorhabditis tropicalis TaxID=1561998 RepID=A0A1I7UI39_9PELO
MRRILVDWLVQAHSMLGLSPETLHLAISIVDRFLELRIIEKEKLQILGISALFLSSKYEEIHVPSSQEYECVAGNEITKNDILEMEKSILCRLQFDISAPSTLIFSQIIGNFVMKNSQKSTKIIAKLSILFGELSLMDATLTTISNATIGCATWILAMKVTMDGEEEEEEWKRMERIILKHVGTKKTEMRGVVEQLARAVHRNFRNARLFAIRKKYETNQYGKASGLLTDDVLKRIEQIGYQ